MCTILGKLARTQFTGWKAVVVKRNGKAYSPTTGIEYKVGDLEVDPDKFHVLSGWFAPVFKPSHHAYNQDYLGRTSVFTTREQAEQFAQDIGFKYMMTKQSYRVRVAKITLYKELCYGNFELRETVSGKAIKKITIL